jgi:hypothetical protein
MFNDRDLGILGAGALLSVLCLFLPLSFGGKIAAGFLVLVSFMVLALLRLGPDRVPPEVWLQRRVRYGLDVRKYVNQQRPSSVGQKTDVKAVPVVVPQVSAPRFQPLDLAWGEVGIYPLLTAFLAVVAVYFAFWLSRGGAEQIAFWFA